FPVVFFNRICAELNAPYVVIDDYKWAFSAVEHLIRQGCTRIVHLAGSEDLLIAQKRKSGYMDALRKYGLPVDEALIIDCGIMMEKGIMAAHQILEMEKLPDGIFAVNDPVAIGAMKTLQKNRIRIPEDIAVVGFSESKEAFIVEPNLTSVEQPTFEMGRNAAQLLLEQIKHNINNDDKMPSKSIILDAKLNIRESSLRKTS
ncbi:LacI family transcriptional regulator, partial [Bacteroides acidifaciens]